MPAIHSNYNPQASPYSSKNNGYIPIPIPHNVKIPVIAIMHHFYASHFELLTKHARACLCVCEKLSSHMLLFMLYIPYVLNCQYFSFPANHV